MDCFFRFVIVEKCGLTFGAADTHEDLFPLVPEPGKHRLIVEGMWGVVNNGGTAHAIKMAGFEIAGNSFAAPGPILTGGTYNVFGLGTAPQPHNPMDGTEAFQYTVAESTSCRKASALCSFAVMIPSL